MFNLVDDSWIPASHGDALELMSLRRVLTQAHALDALQPATPIALAALLRLLLAVIYRALDGPRSTTEAAELFTAGQLPPTAINDYLDKWFHKFDLFGDVAPFLQNADSEDNISSIARLEAAASSGTNKVLFDHSVDSQPKAATAAEAALMLVTRQATAVSDGAGYSPSPGGGVAFIMPQGRNLFETLVLNLVPYLEDENEGDVPSWEREPLAAAQVKESGPRGCRGLADRYSWPSRIARLLPNADGTVSAVRYAAGTKFEPNMSLDPMVAYRLDSKRGMLPLTFQPSRDFWRDFAALLPSSQAEAFVPPRTLVHAYNVYSTVNRAEPIKVVVAGLRNDKAKVEFWRRVTFEIPLVLIRDQGAQAELNRLMEMADESGRLLYGATMQLAANLLTVSDREPLPADISKLARSMPASPSFWSELEKKFPALLARFANDDFNETAAWWKRELRMALRRAWTLAGVSAGNNARAWRALASTEKRISSQMRRLRDAETA